MCLACEEEAHFFRLWCADFLARGEMPPGVAAEDLRAMGLPLPAARSAGAEPSTSANKTMAANAFACDSPDE